MIAVCCVLIILQNVCCMRQRSSKKNVKRDLTHRELCPYPRQALIKPRDTKIISKLKMSTDLCSEPRESRSKPRRSLDQTREENIQKKCDRPTYIHKYRHTDIHTDKAIHRGALLLKIVQTDRDR